MVPNSFHAHLDKGRDFMRAKLTEAQTRDAARATLEKLLAEIQQDLNQAAPSADSGEAARRLDFLIDLLPRLVAQAWPETAPSSPQVLSKSRFGKSKSQFSKLYERGREVISGEDGTSAALTPAALAMRQLEIAASAHDEAHPDPAAADAAAPVPAAAAMAPADDLDLLQFLQRMLGEVRRADRKPPLIVSEGQILRLLERWSVRVVWPDLPPPDEGAFEQVFDPRRVEVWVEMPALFRGDALILPGRVNLPGGGPVRDDQEELRYE